MTIIRLLWSLAALAFAGAVYCTRAGDIVGGVLCGIVLGGCLALTQVLTLLDYWWNQTQEQERRNRSLLHKVECLETELGRFTNG